jgi:hypothetical protein
MSGRGRTVDFFNGVALAKKTFIDKIKADVHAELVQDWMERAAFWEGVATSILAVWDSGGIPSAQVAQIDAIRDRVRKASSEVLTLPAAFKQTIAPGAVEMAAAAKRAVIAERLLLGHHFAERATALEEDGDVDMAAGMRLALAMLADRENE